MEQHFHQYQWWGNPDSKLLCAILNLELATNLIGKLWCGEITTMKTKFCVEKQCMFEIYVAI